MKNVAYALAFAGLLVTLDAFAQQQVAAAPAHSEKIEVTGSNIPRVDAEGALPLQVITREDLAKGSIMTAQDVIDRISAHQSYGAWTEMKGVGSGEFGNTSASLRGLGADRTLVLLNGRRLAPYALSGGAHIDLSGIPAAAIERIEVLKDGASAVYGTDAIGGVINFILRRDFQGVETAASYLKTQQGGGDSWRASFSAGYGDLARDRFNAFMSLDYLKQDALRTSARESTRTAYHPEIGLDSTSPNSFPANVSLTPRGFPTLNPTIPPSGATAASCNPPLSYPTAGFEHICRFDYAAVIDAIPESDKTTLLTRFTYAIAPETQLFAEVALYRGHATQKISPTPVAGVDPPVTIGPDNPFYPAQFIAAAGGDPTRPVRIFYRTVELGPRVIDLTVDQGRFVGGVQGTMGNWDYQGALSYIANREVPYHAGGEPSATAFLPLLRNGVINPFGPNTPQVLDQMRATQVIGQDSDNRASHYGGDFRMSSEMGSLRGGPIGVALGLEARRENLEMVNSEFLYTGDILGGGGAVPSFTSANRKVASIYAELNAPLTNALEATLAVRTDHYDDFGTTTNPKLSMRWRLSPQSLVRASYGTGFRAPTLYELFLPAYDEGLAETVSDPVRCPVTHADEDCLTDILVKTGGNRTLQAEKSKQLNAGIVFEPVRGFSVTLDYYRVEIRDYTTFASLDDMLLRYNVRKPPDTQYPDLPGPIDYLTDFKFNLGTLKTSGSDIDLRWRLPSSSWGQLTLSLTGTYLIDYKVSNTNAGLEPEGAGRRGIEQGAVSRWRHYLMLDWNRGPWGATLAQNFQDGYAEVDLLSCADITLPTTRDNCPSDRHVASYSIVDLQGRYNGIKNLALSLGIRNLFDRAPPLTNQQRSFQVGTDPGYADPRGRMWYGAVRYSFK